MLLAGSILFPFLMSDGYCWYGLGYYTHAAIGNDAVVGNSELSILFQSEYPDMYKYIVEIRDGSATESHNTGPTLTGNNWFLNGGFPEAWWDKGAGGDNALAYYKSFDFNKAYEYIGRVCHLIQDQAVPTHAANISHGLLSEGVIYHEDVFEREADVEGHYNAGTKTLNPATGYSKPYEYYQPCMDETIGKIKAHRWIYDYWLTDDMEGIPDGKGEYGYGGDLYDYELSLEAVTEQLEQAINYTSGALIAASKALQPLVRNLKIFGSPSNAPVIDKETGSIIEFKILENRKDTVRIFMTVDSPLGEPIISPEYGKSGEGKFFILNSNGSDLPKEGTYSVSWDGKLANGRYPSDGQHTLYALVRDEDDNESPCATQNFSINNYPPPVPLLQSPSDFSSISTTRPTLTWIQPPDIDGDAIERNEVRISTDYWGNEWVLDMGEFSPATDFQVPEGYLSKGTAYYWKVRAHDGKAWGDWAMPPRQFYIEPEPGNHPPASATLTLPDGYIRTIIPVLQWIQAIDPDGDPITFNRVIVKYCDMVVYDSGPVPAGTSIAIPEGYLDDGKTYSWQVADYDGKQWGPWSEPREFIVAINYCPPKVTVDTLPHNRTNILQVTFTGIADDTEAGSANITLVEYQVDDSQGAWEAAGITDGAGTPAANWRFTTSALAENALHAIYVRATDADGYISSPAKYVFTTDTTAPLITAIHPLDYRHIEVIFSEPVDKAAAEITSNYVIDNNLNTENAVLEEDNRTVVIGTSWQAFKTIYTAAVDGITDWAGNPILQNTTGAFTGLPAGPYVAYTKPINNAVDVNPDAAIVIVFNVDMNESTLNGDTVLLKKETTQEAIGAAYAYDAAKRALTVMPSAELSGGNGYNVTVTTEALSTTGSPLTEEYQFLFTVSAKRIYDFNWTVNAEAQEQWALFPEQSFTWRVIGTGEEIVDSEQTQETRFYTYNDDSVDWTLSFAYRTNASAKLAICTVAGNEVASVSREVHSGDSVFSFASDIDDKFKHLLPYTHYIMRLTAKSEDYNPTQATAEISNSYDYWMLTNTINPHRESRNAMISGTATINSLDNDSDNPLYLGSNAGAGPARDPSYKNGPLINVYYTASSLDNGNVNVSFSETDIETSTTQSPCGIYASTDYIEEHIVPLTRGDSGYGSVSIGEDFVGTYGFSVAPENGGTVETSNISAVSDKTWIEARIASVYRDGDDVRGEIRGILQIDMPTIDPLPNNRTYSATPTFTGAASDALTGNSAITAVEYQVDSVSGQWLSAEVTSGAGTPSVVWTCTLQPLENGAAHTLYARAKDARGYISMPQSYIFDVNTVPLPDLSVSMSCPGPRQIEGTTAVITAIINNAGTADAGNITVELFDGDSRTGALIESRVITTLKREAGKQEVFQWDTQGKLGAHTLHVYVDRGNSIDEILENNNDAVKEIEVVQNLCDLAIASADIILPSSDLLRGEIAPINAVIRNIGYKPAQNIEVEFFDAWALIERKTIALIGPGESVSVQTTWNTSGLPCGPHLIRVCVDRADLIQEITNANNSSTKSLNLNVIGHTFGFSERLDTLYRKYHIIVYFTHFYVKDISEPWFDDGSDDDGGEFFFNTTVSVSGTSNPTSLRIPCSGLATNRQAGSTYPVNEGIYNSESTWPTNDLKVEYGGNVYISVSIKGTEDDPIWNDDLGTASIGQCLPLSESSGSSSTAGESTGYFTAYITSVVENLGDPYDWVYPYSTTTDPLGGWQYIGETSSPPPGGGAKAQGDNPELNNPVLTLGKITLTTDNPNIVFKLCACGPGSTQAQVESAANVNGVFISGTAIWPNRFRWAKYIGPVVRNIEVSMNEDSPIDIDLATVSANGAPISSCIIETPLAHGALIRKNGSVYTYTPSTNYNGADSFTCKVVQGAITSPPAAVSLVINPVNDAPVVSSIGSKDVNEGAELEFSVSASDADSPVLDYYVRDLPSGAVFDALLKRFSWRTTAAQIGNHTLTFFVDDRNGAVTSETITIRVNGIPVAEDISAMAQQDTSKDITLIAADANNDPLSYEIVDPPSHGLASINGGIAVYAPENGYYGADLFTYRVYDGRIYSNTASVSVIVNAAPILDAIGDKNVDEGTNLEFTINAVDPDNSLPFTYSASGRPPRGRFPQGAAFNPATRTFSWTPTHFQPGDYPFTFKVTDNKGGVDSEAIMIHVAQVPAFNDLSILPADMQYIKESKLLRVTVHNTGDYVLNDVAFAVYTADPKGDPNSPSKLGETMIPQIDASGKISVDFDFSAYHTGIHDVFAWADPYNTVEEIDETNNIAYSALIVGSRRIIVPDNYPTIQEAIDAANAYDTVYVKPGVYNEHIIMKDGINVIGAGWSCTKISGGYTGTAVEMASDSILEGFTVADSDNGIVILQKCNATVRYTKITANGTGMAISNDAEVFVAHNIVDDNTDGIACSYCVGNEKIYNNTISGNETGVRCEYAMIELSNNIIVNNETGIWGGPGGVTYTLSRNDVWNNGVDYSPQQPGADDISENPLFINTANGDYRLQADSPCIDRGIDAGLEYYGTAPDIGAHEIGFITVPDDYASLQDALNSCSEGGRVSVRGGVYRETVSMGDNVKLIGLGWDITKIDGRESNVVVTMGAGNILEGFTVSGGLTGIECGAHTAGQKISNNRVAMNSAAGIAGNDIAVEIINGNIIEQNGIGMLFENCLQALPIYNNTIVRNTTGVKADIAALNLANNIIVHNVTGISRAGGSDVIFSHDDVWDNTTNYDGCAAEAADVSLDPLFKDGNFADYSLGHGSPCIDLGMDAGLPYCGTAPDIGAYEEKRFITVPDQYSTIQNAIDASLEGVTVFVKAGTYDENLSLKKGVIVCGSGRMATILNGAVTMNTLSGIEEFTVTGGITVSAINGSNIYGVDIVNNRITGNGINVNAEYGGKAQVLIAKNLIDTISGAGILSSSGYGNAAIKLYNNTIAGTSIGVSIDWGNIEAVNNILAGNGTGFSINSEYAGITFSKNDLWANSLDYNNCSNGETDIAVDPIFREKSCGNYRLKADSQCIDVGVNTGFPYIGGGPDLGAFEYKPGHAPVAQNISALINENEQIELTLLAGDFDEDPLVYEIVDMPVNGGVSLNGNIATYTPNDGYHGSDPFTYKAYDGEFHSNIAAALIYVDAFPVIEQIGSKDVNEGATLSLPVTAADADNEPLVFSVENSPAGATLTGNGNNTAAFNWTPTYEQAGTYPDIIFTVSDSRGNTDSENVTITVNDINRPPKLAHIGDRFINENEFLTFDLIATDPDPYPDYAMYVIDNAPPGGMLLDHGDRTATFTWMPTYEQAGIYPDITFTVMDGYSNADSEAITITVNDINRPPELDPIGNKEINEDALLTFIVTATDLDNDPLTYSIKNPPSGAMLINNGNNTATFNWTPTYEQAGDYGLIFVIKDNKSAEDSETITIHVNDISKHDLIISPQWLMITPENNKGSVRIYNAGTFYERNFAVAVYSGDPEGNPLSPKKISEETVYQVAPSDFAEFTFDLSNLPEENCTLYMWVDIYNAIEETDEANNIISYPVSLFSMWSNEQFITSGRYYKSLHSADMNGDGKDEVIAGYAGSPAGIDIWQYDNSANSWTLQETVTKPGLYDVHDISSGDFDKDGDIDLALAMRFVGLGILINNGNGDWAYTQLDSTYGNSVEVCDIDQDGMTDIVFSPGGWMPDYAKVFYGDGTGAFPDTGGPTPPSSVGGGYFVLIDLDNDGLLDIIGTSAEYDQRGQPLACLRAYLNEGNRVWSPSLLTDNTFGVLGNPDAAGDVNEDGCIDYIGLNYPAESSKIVEYCGGKDAGNNLLWQKKELPMLEEGLGWVTLSDADKDGHLDLLVCGGTAYGGLRVYYGDGKGNFSAVQPFAENKTVYKAETSGDYNGDGRPDIAFNLYPSGGFGVIMSDTRRLILWNKLGSDYAVAHSEAGVNGTWSGQALYDSAKFANGATHRFNRQNCVSFNSALTSEDVFTIEFWIKTPYDVPDTLQIDGQNLNLFYIISGSDHNTGFIAAIDSAQLNAAVYHNWPPYSSLYRWNVSWRADELHHIAIVYDNSAGSGQYIKFYFDGELQTSTVMLADSPWEIERPMDLHLGIWLEPNAGIIGAENIIDNIKIYNYAKTDFSDRFYEGNLILWNKLGSDTEVVNSVVGPGLAKMMRQGGNDCAYIDGKFGKAIRFPDSYPGGTVLSGPMSIINKAQGCVEMWIKPPLDVQNGIIQNMPRESWAVFYAQKWDGIYDSKGLTVYFGQGDANKPNLMFTYFYNNTWTEIHDSISTYSSDQWAHIATVWDINKQIDGNKSLAMYVNGIQVAYSQDDIQMSLPWRDIFTLGGDFLYSQNFRSGAVDNLKIWDYAKTNFSDRFAEGYSVFVNTPPIASAVITSRLTNKVLYFDFSGNGSDEDGLIAGCEWSSNIDGVLNSQDKFSLARAQLTPGQHTIMFKVKDNEGTWSEPVNIDLVVPQNIKPIARARIYIDTNSSHVNVSFDAGDSADRDGYITEYWWYSSRKGYLGNSKYLRLNRSVLGAGMHIITLKVKDNEGAWSNPVSTTINVPANILPVIDHCSIRRYIAGRYWDWKKFAWRDKVCYAFSGGAHDVDGTIADRHWYSNRIGIFSHEWKFDISRETLGCGWHAITFVVIDNEGGATRTVRTVKVQ